MAVELVKYLYHYHFLAMQLKIHNKKSTDFFISYFFLFENYDLKKHVMFE